MARGRAAIVVMPWIDVETCSLGAASLKAYLQAHGVSADVHYLNLRLADRIGLPLSLAMSRNPQRWPEWFFAYHLFGPGGAGELRHTLDQLADEPSFRAFRDGIGLSREACRRLLEDDVPAFLEDSLQRIPWGSYDLVGFSSTMYSHVPALTLARRVKERFGPAIVFGGPNVQGDMGRETLRLCDWVDCVVDGEGEAALLELASAGPGGARRAGLRTAAPVDLALLPAPDHDDYFRTLASCGQLGGLAPVVTVETSRGCWWGQRQHCTFCGIQDEALIYRAQPAEIAADRIWELHRRYGANRIYATDLIMSIDHLKDLLPRLARLRRREESDLQLFYEIKSNLTRPQIEALAEAGVCEIQPGIESLSTPSLRRMKKGVRAIQNVQTLKLAMGAGIKVKWNYLHGFPGEAASELEEAADAVLSLTHLQPPTGFGPVRPDRFSPYRERPGDFGLTPPAPEGVYRYLYPPRAALDRLAYSFDFAPGEVPGAGEPALRRLEEAVKAWSRLWSSNFFASRRGASRVELFDSRPLERGGAASECREHELRGIEAEVFRACETVRVCGEIAAVCGVSREEAEGVLERMRRRRWVFGEAGLWINLAVPVSRLPPGQRYRFEALQAASRSALRPAWPLS